MNRSVVVTVCPIRSSGQRFPILYNHVLGTKWRQVSLSVLILMMGSEDFLDLDVSSVSDWIGINITDHCWEAQVTWDVTRQVWSFSQKTIRMRKYSFCDCLPSHRSRPGEPVTPLGRPLVLTTPEGYTGLTLPVHTGLVLSEIQRPTPPSPVDTDRVEKFISFRTVFFSPNLRKGTGVYHLSLGTWPNSLRGGFKYRWIWSLARTEPLSEGCLY